MTEDQSSTTTAGAPEPAPVTPGTPPSGAVNILQEPPAPAPPAREQEMADLQARLDQLRAESLAAKDDVTEMRCTSHALIVYGGITVGSDWTPVPTRLTAMIQTAAQNAGAELEVKES